MKIINKYYNFNKIDKKIVLISDIHYYNKQDIKLLDRVLYKIKDLHPDYICISGDITDISNIYDEEDLINWLKRLSSITKILVTLGNHEYYIKGKEYEFKLNEGFISSVSKIKNLYLLRNENVVIDGINFIGLDLGIKYYFNKEYSNIEIGKFIKKNCYNVLICHSHINIDNKNIDLVLCGHMHGGIVPRVFRPIFKRRGIISPTKKLFPKYVYGLKKIENTNIIITSGIRMISHINKFYLFRNLFYSEIVVINA